MVPSKPPRRISFPLIFLTLAATLVFAWAESGLLKRDLDVTSFEQIYAMRDAYARAASRALVAVVYAESEKELYYGTRLAFWDEQAKEEKVTVPGKSVNDKPHPRDLKVDIVPFATGDSVDAVWDQTEIARKLARDPNYVAVIGHTTSAVAMQSSVSYEYTKLLYIATTATDPALTDHGFGYVFRVVGTDTAYAREVADMCYLLDRDANGNDSPVQKVGTFYAQSQHSMIAMEGLEKALTDRGMVTIFEKSYDPALGSEEDTLAKHQRKAILQDTVQSVEHLKPDMIALLGDGTTAATELWKALSRSGLKDVPLVVTGGPLDANAFINNTNRQPNPRNPDQKSYATILHVSSSTDNGQRELKLVVDSEGIREPGAIYVATQFSTAQGDLDQDDLDKREPEFRYQAGKTKDFNQQYVDWYGKDPNPALRNPEALALRGYTAGMILKEAMEHSESIAPIDVQQTLRLIEFQALGRKYRFELNGNEKGLGTPDLPIIFKRFSRRNLGLKETF